MTISKHAQIGPERTIWIFEHVLKIETTLLESSEQSTTTRYSTTTCIMSYHCVFVRRILNTIENCWSCGDSYSRTTVTETRDNFALRAMELLTSALNFHSLSNFLTMELLNDRLSILDSETPTCSNHCSTILFGGDRNISTCWSVVFANDALFQLSRSHWSSFCGHLHLMILHNWQ